MNTNDTLICIYDGITSYRTNMPTEDGRTQSAPNLGENEDMDPPSHILFVVVFGVAHSLQGQYHTKMMNDPPDTSPTRKTRYYHWR
jgi:hypothetical protein